MKIPLGYANVTLVNFMVSLKSQSMSDNSKSDFKHANVKGFMSQRFLYVSYEIKLSVSQYVNILQDGNEISLK